MYRCIVCMYVCIYVSMYVSCMYVCKSGLEDSVKLYYQIDTIMTSVKLQIRC